jgi:hypothetical protein
VVATAKAGAPCAGLFSAQAMAVAVHKNFSQFLIDARKKALIVSPTRQCFDARITHREGRVAS